MADVEITAEFENAGFVARDLERVAVEVGREHAQSMDELADESDADFTTFAPELSGRLHRGIVAFPAGDGYVISAEAIDPETGFDYVPVSRFGRAAVVPKTAGALKTPFGFISAAAPFEPGADWRDQALPTVRASAESVGSELGRRIEALT